MGDTERGEKGDSGRMQAMRIALTTGIMALGAGALIVPAVAQNAAGDPARGRTVFARCAACHAVMPGTNRLGPSLAGVMGRKAGSATGFNYSPAMKGSKVVWNARSLDGFLTRPAAVVPGNKMVFAGMPNAADRANLIAYLGTVR
jgi:cytochrome c